MLQRRVANTLFFSAVLCFCAFAASSATPYFAPIPIVGPSEESPVQERSVLALENISFTRRVLIYCTGPSPFVPTFEAGARLTLRELPIADPAEPLDVAALAAGREVASVVLPEMDCSESLAVTMLAAAPSQPGDYYWGVCMNPIFLDGELLNDLSLRCGNWADLIHVSARPRPDLIVSPPRFFAGVQPEGLDPDVAEPGNALIVSVSVTNIGPGAAAATTVEFFIDGRRIEDQGRPVSVATGQLAAGGLNDLRVPLRAPDAPGRYTLEACSLLAGTTQAEASPENVSENNCSGPTTLVVKETRPGLAVVEKFTIEPSPPGEESRKLTAGYRLFNPGDAASSPTVVHFYSSAEPSLEGARLLESAPVESLGAGRRFTAPTSLERVSRSLMFYNACIEDVCGPVWVPVGPE